MKRPYWFSIRAYPPNYRREHGGELIDTADAMNNGRWSGRQAASFLVHGARQSVVDPRRWWGLSVLFPVFFALTQAGVLYSWSQVEQPQWHAAVYNAGFVFKWLTAPSLPVLLVLMAERIGERPERWRAATASWVLLGGGAVLAVTVMMGSISKTISDGSYHRMWPTTTEAQSWGHLEAQGWSGESWFGGSWVPTQIIVHELAAVVVIALATGLMLRRCAVGDARMAAAAVPITIMGVLVCYRISTPWAFVDSYDFFAGDAVVGATSGELLYFFAPLDPIAAMLIGLAATSMGGLVLAWGGAAVPVAARQHQLALDYHTTSQICRL